MVVCVEVLLLYLFGVCMIVGGGCVSTDRLSAVGSADRLLWVRFELNRLSELLQKRLLDFVVD